MLSFLLLPVLFFGVAQSLPVIGEDVNDGQIVSLHGNVYELSSGEYDDGIYGVVSNNPAVLLDIAELDSKQSVLQTGIARVTVSTVNGPILSGDFVTSSGQPGIGMKATRPGFVLGNALEPYDGGDLGQIEVSINPHLAAGGEAGGEGDFGGFSGFGGFGASLGGVVNSGLVGALDKPSVVLRYLVAAIVVVASFGFGFFVFGRIAANGIVAMGRNPLAKKSIGVVIIFNVSMTIAVIGAGLAVAYFILVL